LNYGVYLMFNDMFYNDNQNIYSYLKVKLKKNRNTQFIYICHKL